MPHIIRQCRPLTSMIAKPIGRPTLQWLRHCLIQLRPGGRKNILLTLCHSLPSIRCRPAVGLPT
ncbi:uncharacterized protein LY79DRAFT_555433 [Colletotrichum navitas]|uniref:Uncharacterized protein n=1 Tax=Colletotrichum navitas TaxID=681940 RepID=A0AAD8PY71_9PEZI|nr:uncharacterized protein LY79DRAFT_555433 [Colletotrichum navitas]KAK1590216.1 hypothetical protein LY79DRAFT_555433 [Colletotrichum navitas]